LVLETYAGPWPEVLGRSLHVGEDLVGNLMLSERSYCVLPDGYLAPERTSMYDQGQPFGTVVELQLGWQNESIGVLFVDDHVGRTFTAEDAQRLRLFSDHAPLLLKNADLLAGYQKPSSNCSVCWA